MYYQIRCNFNLKHQIFIVFVPLPLNHQVPLSDLGSIVLYQEPLLYKDVTFRLVNVCRRPFLTFYTAIPHPLQLRMCMETPALSHACYGICSWYMHAVILFPLLLCRTPAIYTVNIKFCIKRRARRNVTFRMAWQRTSTGSKMALCCARCLAVPVAPHVTASCLFVVCQRPELPSSGLFAD